MGGEEDDEEDTFAFACVRRAADSQLPTHEEIFPAKKWHEAKPHHGFFLKIILNTGCFRMTETNGVVGDMVLVPGWSQNQ